MATIIYCTYSIYSWQLGSMPEAPSKEHAVELAKKKCPAGTTFDGPDAAELTQMLGRQALCSERWL